MKTVTLTSLLKVRFIGTLTILLLAFLSTSIFMGQYLKDHAVKDWEDHAYREAQSITNQGLSWLSVFQANLRSLATLFHASDHVGIDEFYDALVIVEDSDVAAPLVSWGVAKAYPPHNEKDTYSFPVVMASNDEGSLSKGKDLSLNQVYRETALKAIYNPGRIITGSPYTDKNNNRHVMFAMTVPCHDCETAILFSSLDMDDFFQDLQSLYIPKGLSLQQGEIMYGVYDYDAGIPIIGPFSNISPSSRTVRFSTESGGARWRFTWLIEDSYRGGPSLGLARTIQWGGTILGLILFALFVHLSRENSHAIRLAEIKTQELQEALLQAEHANARLEHISRLDGLTQIPNRRFLEETLERIKQSAKDTPKPTAVIKIDIDEFRAYNKAMGHTAGDTCLQTIAAILHDTIQRPNDILGRFGNAEFVGILPETDFEGVQAICERLKQAVTAAKIPHPTSEIISVSVGGIVCVSPHTIDSETLLAEVDLALLSAKSNGLNQIYIKQLSG